MKYKYGKVPESQIIKNYKVFLNSIVVTFLDNTTCQIPYSEENEQNIIRMMTGQAQERNNKKEFKDVKSVFKYDTLLTAGMGISTFMCACLASSQDNASYLILTFAMGATAAYSLVETIKSKDKLDDFKKYSLFLANGGRKIDADEEININTLDNFDLDELKEKNKVFKKQVKLNS